MSEQQFSKHERRKQKIEQHHEERQRGFKEIEKKGKIKKFGAIAIALIFFGSIFSFFAIFAPSNPTGNAVLNTAGLTFPLNQIHWHAIPTIELCGLQKSIPTPIGSAHLGGPLLHTHEDAKIHIEGSVSDPSQITLGNFFENIGVKFSETQIIDKTNGDTCPDGGIGQVKMLVNNLPSTEFRNYVIKDGDLINIKFE